MAEVIDTLGRHIEVGGEPQRIVSLVPSETLCVFDLVGSERLVGRTDYCIEPKGQIESIPTVGGTKSIDVEAVRALEPDLVLANKEENSRPLVQALIDAGLRVHVSFPCTVADSLEYLDSLCRLLGLDPARTEIVRCVRECVHELETGTGAATEVPVFVPIWKDPWMTFDGRVYASDVLRLCGAQNVFAERARLYPLAADLGQRSPLAEERVGERDTRYPRIRLAEVVERGARVVLLPDEPYEFEEADAAVFDGLGVEPPLQVELVDGRQLFWYGTQLSRSAFPLRDRILHLSGRSGA